MVLLMTYRWRLAPRIQQSARDRTTDAVSSEDLPAARLRAMFAPFEDAAMDAMLRYDWPGNLRELERVASDLFCDADQRLDATIRYEHVMQVIAAFFMPQPLQAAVRPASEPAIAESTRLILDSVEHALRQQRFNIGAILDGLKVYKLGSRPTLRRFLIKHKDLLSADIAAESKVQRFMQTRA
jgi:DNA-binding NtrC family response regulator